jgi:hypothetical protein
MYLIQGCAGFESKGTLSFERSLNIRSYGYQRVSQPHPVRAGETSERFEVRDGDCYWNSGWNDCKTDRERSELTETSPLATIGFEYWYGWSLFVPKDFPNIYPTITTLGQFNQKVTNIPPVMFNLRWSGFWLMMYQYDHSFLLIPEDDFRNRWHDIIVHVKWSTDFDGFLKVWVNGQLKVEHFGPQTWHNYPIYFKYGIYRTEISKYKLTEGADRVPTQIVYFDEVRGGRSRESVDPSLRK